MWSTTEVPASAQRPRTSRTPSPTSASFGYGTRSFAAPALKHNGTYTVRLAATDLAGNFNRIVGTIQVS